MKNPPLYSPINPHFFKPLLPGFTNHLDIPVTFFLKYLEGCNEGKPVELRTDASEITWKVKMDGRRLSDGWEDFVVAHDLRVGDIVVFRHEGELMFHVSALGPSCCEIQYEEDSDKTEKLCETKKVSRTKKSPETEADSSTDQSCFVVNVTDSNLRRDTVYLPKMFAMSTNGLLKKFQIVLRNEKGESWKIDLRHEAYSGRFYMRRGWTSFCFANGKKHGDLLTFKLVRNEETPVLELLPLNSEDLDKLDPSDNTRQGKCLEANEKDFLGVEATDKEFLGVEGNRNDTRQGNCFEAASEKEYLPCEKPTNDDIKQGEEYVSTESNTKEVNSNSIPTSQNRFVTLTLTPTSFKTCRLSLPSKFTKGNGINTAGKITMLDRDSARWSTSLLMDHNKRGTMSLGRGWKGFCEVNDVKMDESLVLELIWEEDTVPVLKFCSKG